MHLVAHRFLSTDKRETSDTLHGVAAYLAYHDVVQLSQQIIHAQDTCTES